MFVVILDVMSAVMFAVMFAVCLQRPMLSADHSFCLDNIGKTFWEDIFGETFLARHFWRYILGVTISFPDILDESNWYQDKTEWVNYERDIFVVSHRQREMIGLEGT